MDRPAKLLIGALLGLLGVSAFAGYAQLADPPGFSGGPGDWKFAPSANDAHFGKVVHQPNGLKFPVGGTPVTMPAGYRFAANAPRIAAGIIFMNPYVRTAAGIAAWLLSAKVMWDEANQVWKKISDSEDQNDGAFEYAYSSNTGLVWFSSFSEACGYGAQFESKNGVVYTVTGISGTAPDKVCGVSLSADGQHISDGSLSITHRPAACPGGWTSTPAGCLPPGANQPLDVEQFKDLLNPQPMPDTVPWELPYPSPLPVEKPWINPAPGPNPDHRPKFVPTGDPVKNPNYDPNAQPSPENQPFIQPGVRLQPSPTDTQPWRIDVQPVDRPQPTPEPLGEQDEGPGQTNPGDKPQEQSDLCEKHPDIVACAKMDDVKPDQVNNEDKPLTITPESGWGNENATCPAPVTKQVAGLNLEMSWQPFCDFASGIRPVVIAMAWLSAALFVLGVARKGD